MADSRAEPRAPEAVLNGRDSDDLATLVARLGADVVGLLDTKLGMIKLDVEHEVRGYGHAVLAQLAAAAVVVVGVALTAAGAAFALTWALPETFEPLLARALAFGTVGLLAVGAGWVALRRLGVGGVVTGTGS